MRLLAVALAVASTSPAWTAQGTITALHEHSITVHGHTCRMTGRFGDYVAHRWDVGDGAKIDCTGGLLRKIAVAALPGLVVKAPSASPGGIGTGISVGVAGAVTVTQISPTSITFVPTTVGPTQAGSTYTCAITQASPDVSGIEVGDHPQRIDCTNGILAVLVRS